MENTLLHSFEMFALSQAAPTPHIHTLINITAVFQTVLFESLRADFFFFFSV